MMMMIIIITIIIIFMVHYYYYYSYHHCYPIMSIIVIIVDIIYIILIMWQYYLCIHLCPLGAKFFSSSIITPSIQRVCIASPTTIFYFFPGLKSNYLIETTIYGSRVKCKASSKPGSIYTRLALRRPSFEWLHKFIFSSVNVFSQ